MSVLLDKAIQAKDLALSLGAQEAKVVISHARGVDLSYRDQKIEKFEDHTEQSLGISLLVDGRFSGHSTSDLRPSALKSFIENAIEMTKYLEVDPYRTLPDPSYYLNRADIDLDTIDPSYRDLSAEKRQEKLLELTELSRQSSSHLPVISVSSSIGDSYFQSARVHSNGFVGESEGTSFYVTTEVNLKEADGKRPNGTAFSAQRHQSDLENLHILAQRASKRAESKLNPQKLKTGKYTILVENYAVSRLLGPLLGPLSGSALQQKRSIWDGRLDTQIATPLLTLIDEPHIVRGLGSALWDDDGASTHRRAIIENGVLKTYFINDYYAKKMSMPFSGGGMNNLKWGLGKYSFDALIKEVGNGVILDRFLGGNSNSTTGEFSFGCGGKVIQNGEIVESISEVNVSGNITQLWKDLVLIGNDPYRESAMGVPSCVFENVQLSGI